MHSRASSGSDDLAHSHVRGQGGHRQGLLLQVVAPDGVASLGMQVQLVLVAAVLAVHAMAVGVSVDPAKGAVSVGGVDVTAQVAV